ncbi:MAG: tetraacyldisaccharide 4'-kinase [Gammaproteobacteria bacterium]|nr:tetraacyldisaccharide 4'-kinase [Gammaproteobacteria bacterium]
MHDWLLRVWYGARPERWLLWPLSLLYRLIVAARRRAYASGVLRMHYPASPVVVVGNITAGGTGKTPLVIWLASRLAAEGRRPGIVTRGYGAHARAWPRLVSADCDPIEVGDESVLLARRCACPVAAGPDRVAAARLLETGKVDVILADDGLQHYRLGRQFEIAVIDASRGFGNGFCLPAGPLREPATRLADVDAVVENVARGETASGDRIAMHVVAHVAVALVSGERRPLESFRGAPVHGVAGIGNPQRFFHQLAGFGLQVIEHPLPDHAELSDADIWFPDGGAVLMTEKDAVKCAGFASAHHWYVPVEARLSDADATGLMSRLHRSISDKSHEYHQVII